MGYIAAYILRKKPCRHLINRLRESTGEIRIFIRIAKLNIYAGKRQKEYEPEKLRPISKIIIFKDTRKGNAVAELKYLINEILR